VWKVPLRGIAWIPSKETIFSSNTLWWKVVSLRMHHVFSILMSKVEGAKAESRGRIDQYLVIDGQSNQRRSKREMLGYHRQRK
jgi:hypothetical protein